MIWTCVYRSNFIKIQYVYFPKFVEETQEDVLVQEEKEEAASCEACSEGMKFLGCWFVLSSQLNFIKLVTIKGSSSYTFYNCFF